MQNTEYNAIILKQYCYNCDFFEKQVKGDNLMNEKVLLVDLLYGRVYRRLNSTGNNRIGTVSSKKFEDATNNKVAKANVKN